MKQLYSKKLYSLKESFMHLVRAFVTIKYFKNGRKTNTISEKFQERLMLATTKVNGCAMCSYAHTKMALSAGLSDYEVRALLESDDQNNIPDEELNAVMFASYYAECRANVERDIWVKIVEEYNIEKALGILGAIRAITVGNSYGIPLGSFLSRFKIGNTKKDPRSNVFYELAMIITFIPFTIVALVVSFFLKLFKKKLV